jgi:hypothetical protein
VVKSHLEFYPGCNRAWLSAGGQVMCFKKIAGDIVDPAIVMQEILLIAGKPAMSELREYPFAGRPFFPAQLWRKARPSMMTPPETCAPPNSASVGAEWHW